MDSKFEKKPFTLTMLGSLTDFTPELKKTPKSAIYTKGTKVKDFPKGEILSVISSLIKSNTLTKTLDTKNPYSLYSDEFSVINGPKIDGADVGEKIALGLSAILKAIARGRTSINIIAHSRGAIEAILIAHELETIQTIITSCANFEEILKYLTQQQTQRLKGKPINNTPDIIETLKYQINLIPKEELESWFYQLKINIPNIFVNFFGTDPVPGDCFPITWYDCRYFVLPKIIKNTELIYYANEHSDWGFTPVFPEVTCNESQHLHCYSMPGHHGTGSSGNNGSQQGVIVSADGYKTTHVQKLLIYKILYFLSRQGVEFKNGLDIFHQHSALGRKYLGSNIQDNLINVAELDFPAIFRILYSRIEKNKIAYEAYNTTNYSYMGLTKQRKIMHKGRAIGFFNEFFKIHAGYINEEHALLMREQNKEQEQEHLDSQSMFSRTFSFFWSPLNGNTTNASVQLENTLKENIVSLTNS